MKVDFKNAWLNLLKASDAHKPELLTGIGISLMAIAVPLAVVATVKTEEKIREKKEEKAEIIRKESDHPEVPVNVDSIELPVKEVIKIAWKYYIPSLAATATGAFCSASSTKEGLKRTAEAIGMYQLSELAAANYRNKTREVIGEKKEEEISNRLVKDRMELVRDEDGHIASVYDTRDGSTLCFDYWSGRYFYSDIDYIRRQINVVNETMLKESLSMEGWATLNDVYNAIGLPETGSAEHLIWRVPRDGIITLRPSSILVDGDKPCWVLNFATPPQYSPPWEFNRL